MDSSSETRELKKLAKALKASIAESLYFQGELTESDLLNPEILEDKILSQLGKLDISFVVDYQSSLLREAERYEFQKNYELAYVLYATYFEHLINGIIQIKLSKKRISQEAYKALVRRISIEDKLTWLLEVIGLPKFNEVHRQTIKLIGEGRNNFIHYKYQPKKSSDPYTEIEWEKIKDKIKAAVKYSKTYQTRVSYEGKANKLRLQKRNNPYAT